MVGSVERELEADDRQDRHAPGNEVHGGQRASPERQLECGAVDRVVVVADPKRRNTFEQNRPLLVALIEALAQAERSEELRDQLAELYEESRAAIGEMISGALGEEGLNADQLRACASFLIAVSEGLMLQWLVSGGSAPTGEQLIEGLEAALPLALAREAATQ